MSEGESHNVLFAFISVGEMTNSDSASLSTRDKSVFCCCCGEMLRLAIRALPRDSPEFLLISWCSTSYLVIDTFGYFFLRDRCKYLQCVQSYILKAVSDYTSVVDFYKHCLAGS